MVQARNGIFFSHARHLRTARSSRVRDGFVAINERVQHRQILVPTDTAERLVSSGDLVLTEPSPDRAPDPYPAYSPPSDSLSAPVTPGCGRWAPIVEEADDASDIDALPIQSPIHYPEPSSISSIPSQPPSSQISSSSSTQPRSLPDNSQPSHPHTPISSQNAIHTQENSSQIQNPPTAENQGLEVRENANIAKSILETLIANNLDIKTIANTIEAKLLEIHYHYQGPSGTPIEPTQDLFTQLFDNGLLPSIRTYPCHLCSEQFNNACHLYVHIDRVHGSKEKSHLWLFFWKQYGFTENWTWAPNIRYDPNSPDTPDPNRNTVRSQKIRKPTSFSVNCEDIKSRDLNRPIPCPCC